VVGATKQAGGNVGWWWVEACGYDGAQGSNER
jgi:hypothetical protein